MDSNKLTGIGLFIFFAGMLGYSYYTTNSLDFDLKTYTQLAISGMGSFYLLVYKNFASIKTFVTGLLKGKGGLVDSKDFNSRDFEALVYLKERATNISSKEAFELVCKLNNLLFMGDGPTPEVKRDEKNE